MGVGMQKYFQGLLTAFQSWVIALAYLLSKNLFMAAGYFL
jgi:hypothetical protein